MRRSGRSPWTLDNEVLQPLLALSKGRIMLVRRFAAGETDFFATFADLVRRHGQFLVEGHPRGVAAARLASTFCSKRPPTSPFVCTAKPSPPMRNVVSRLEPARPTLAELIERIVAEEGR